MLYTILVNGIMLPIKITVKTCPEILFRHCFVHEGGSFFVLTWRNADDFR